MRHSAIITLCAALALAACHRHNAADDELSHHHHHHAEAHHEHADGDHHEHADGEIVLAPAVAERFGVEVDTIVATPMATTLRATGMVLDAATGAGVVSAPVSGIVKFAAGIQPGARVRAGALVATVDAHGAAGGDSNAAAKAALDAAKRELDRLEPLRADRLVTAEAYNAALAAYESARAAYSAPAAGGRATAPIAGTITALSATQGQYVEVGSPIASISAATRLVLRVDVPERMRGSIAGVNGVNIRVPGSEDIVALKARRIAAAPGMPLSMPGYVPVYFEFDNDGSVAPGSGVDAWLTSAAAGAPVLSVPRTALYEQQGSYFVFVRLDEDCYMKIPVQLGESDGVRTAIVAGLKGGEAVVTKGVTAVRLAETSGAVPEGHSHNH